MDYKQDPSQKTIKEIPRFEDIPEKIIKEMEEIERGEKEINIFEDE